MMTVRAIRLSVAVGAFLTMGLCALSSASLAQSMRGMTGMTGMSGMAGDAKVRRKLAPLVETARRDLAMIRNDWIKFRDFRGRQWVHFEVLVAQTCGLAEIRYGMNGGDLVEQFPLPLCDPRFPRYEGSEETTTLTYPPHSIRTVAVQIVYADGSRSAVRSYRPCYVRSDELCSLPVE